MSEGSERAGPLDRRLQRQLLQEMRAAYPGAASDTAATADEDRLNANLLYLEEHGLCRSGLSRSSLEGFFGRLSGPTITAAGLDFLEEDGGLSAILGVVTIKLHADTLRELIAAKLESAPVAENEKGALRRHLATIPETVLQAAATDLVRRGLDVLPDVAHWLRTLAGP